VTVGSSEKMSKSKKNVIAPESIIDVYGADTIRWFMLSDTPPERDIEWTDEGASGCWDFVRRVWRLVEEAGALPPPGTAIPDELNEYSSALRGIVHRRIRDVTDHLENLRFNRAVANIYELANILKTLSDKHHGSVKREALEALILLSAPMMPHLAESCWEQLGYDTLAVDAFWPKWNPDLVLETVVTYAIQVNGKLRATRQFAKGTDKAMVEKEALALEPVVRALEGKAPKRVIVVPERIVNIVA
jgi:leucyl-tRNA synthetase